METHEELQKELDELNESDSTEDALQKTKFGDLKMHHGMLWGYIEIDYKSCWIPLGKLPTNPIVYNVFGQHVGHVTDFDLNDLILDSKGFICYRM